MEHPESESTHRHHTGRPLLDLVLGISAIFISVISLFLVIHNGRALERLVQANSWPYVALSYATSNPDGTPHVRLVIANKGVGPASIESLEVQYKGRPVGSARELLDSILNRTTSAPPPKILTRRVVPEVLAAREEVSFVDLVPTTDYSAQDYAALDAGLRRVRMIACYCSVFGDCWLADTGDRQPAEVKTCPGPRRPFQ